MPEALVIPEALDLLAAQSLRETVLQGLGPQAVTLDIAAATPNAVSLQVFVATYRSLSTEGLLAGLGPNATAVMANVNL